MESNSPTLAQRQKKHFETKVGSFKFKANLKGAKMKCSPRLDVHRSGIKLHFFRYALFPRDAVKDPEKQYYIFDHTGDIEEQPEELFPEGAPIVDGFYYGRTTLLGGYLYLMDANDPDMWWEIKIDNAGNYYPVYWEKWVDIREASKQSVKHLVFKPNTELWVAHSPVQWSIDYHHLIRNDEKRRSKSMVKIRCTGFRSDEEPTTSDIVPFDRMYSAGRGQYKINKLLHIPKWQELAADHNSDKEKDSEAIKEDMFVTLQCPLSSMCDICEYLREKKFHFKAFIDALQTGESINQVKERYENKSSHPKHIDKEYQSLFILALSTYKIVYDDVKNTVKYDGGKPGLNSNDNHFPEEHKEHLKILDKYREKWIKENENNINYSSAYDFKDKFNKLKKSLPNYTESGIIGYGVDRTKVEAILGVHERKEMRDELNKIIDTYGTFITSDYLRVKLEDFLHNTPNNTLKGKGILLEAVSELLFEPYTLDKPFLLAKDIPKEIGKWRNFVYKITDPDPDQEPDQPTSSLKSDSPTYKGLEPLYALISGKLNITDVNNVNKIDISNKLAGVYRSRLDVFKNRIFDYHFNKHLDLYKVNKKPQKFIFDKLSKDVLVNNKPCFKLSFKEIDYKLKNQNLKLDYHQINNNKRFKLNDTTSIVIGEKDVTIISESHIELELPIEGEKITSKDLTINKKNIKAKHLLDHKAFKGIIAGLQVFNFTIALDDYLKKRDSKAGWNAFGIGCDLSEAVTSIILSCLESGVIIGSTATATVASSATVASTSNASLVFKALNKSFGVIGAGVTAGLSIYDSKVCFTNYDIDAGIANGLAGLFFSTTFATTLITSIWEACIITGPIGWVPALLGTAFYILGTILKDSDLEFYFKHYILSDHESFANSQKLFPVDYSRMLIERGKEKVREDESQENYMLPVNALTILFDTIVCPTISFKSLVSDTKIAPYNIGYCPGGNFLRTVQIKKKYYSFTIEMTFFQFVDSNSDFIKNMKLFLYPFGIENGEAVDLISGENKAFVMMTIEDKDPFHIKYKFDIPKQLRTIISIRSEILFALNVFNKDAPDFPLRLNNETRHLGVKFKVGESVLGITTFMLEPDQIQKVKILPLNKLKQASSWN